MYVRIREEQNIDFERYTLLGLLTPQGRVFQKVQNMQCVAKEWMQVVARYCNRYATKIIVFQSLFNLGHPF